VESGTCSPTLSTFTFHQSTTDNHTLGVLFFARSLWFRFLKGTICTLFLSPLVGISRSSVFCWLSFRKQHCLSTKPLSLRLLVRCDWAAHALTSSQFTSSPALSCWFELTALLPVGPICLRFSTKPSEVQTKSFGLGRLQADLPPFWYTLFACWALIISHPQQQLTIFTILPFFFREKRGRDGPRF
jgi:hypothetical protein